MRLLLSLAAFLLTLYSCDRGNNQKSRFDLISRIDTTCLNELKIASADIQKGKLTYCHFAGSMLYISLRNAHEMDSLLNKFGINYKEEMTSDVIYPDQTQGCYCDFMKEQIDARFGKTFIDSLLNVSDSLYVLNNLNDTFNYADFDTQPNYPGDTETYQDEFSDVFQKDLDNSINYPSGYIKRPNYDTSAFVDTYIYVDKAGNANIIGYRFLFNIESNYKYEKHFETEIEKVIRKTGWTPATIRNQKVNSSMVMRLYFD